MRNRKLKMRVQQDNGGSRKCPGFYRCTPLPQHAHSLCKQAGDRHPALRSGSGSVAPALGQATEVDDWDRGTQGQHQGERKRAPPAPSSQCIGGQAWREWRLAQRWEPLCSMRCCPGLETRRRVTPARSPEIDASLIGQLELCAQRLGCSGQPKAAGSRVQAREAAQVCIPCEPRIECDAHDCRLGDTRKQLERNGQGKARQRGTHLKRTGASMPSTSGHAMHHHSGTCDIHTHNKASLKAAGGPTRCMAACICRAGGGAGHGRSSQCKPCKPWRTPETP